MSQNMLHYGLYNEYMTYTVQFHLAKNRIISNPNQSMY
jgi:hypothetical protein